MISTQTVNHDSGKKVVVETFPTTTINHEVNTYEYSSQLAGTQTAPLMPRSQKPIANADTASTSTERIFKISNSTPMHKLAEIEELAKRAGVDFNYKTRIGGKKLKSIKIQLNTSYGNSVSRISFNGKFDFTIGWLEDDSGRALKLYHPPAEEALLEIKRKIDITTSLFNQQCTEIEVQSENEAEIQLQIEQLRKQHESDLKKLYQAIEELERENDE